MSQQSSLEGDLVRKCSVCEKEITEDIFWTIFRWEKKTPTFECPKCGKKFTVEEKVDRETYEIKKECKCPLELTKTVLEDSVVQWKRTFYCYCENCFKEAFGNILFLHLSDKYG